MNSDRWKQSLENLRTKEIDLVFEGIDTKFDRGLELGAGNGFQSHLLMNHLDYLESTDLNDDRLPKSSIVDNIRYTVLDAEDVGRSFDADSFDFVFSSNLLEHLPNVENCLKGVHKVIKQDGLVVHIVPSPGWRLLSVLLHYPHKAVNIFTRLMSPSPPNTTRGNNLKVSRGVNSKILDLLIPKAHGISKNFILEFFAFSKKKWVDTFENAGFKILAIKRGPISSGYGFGFERLKVCLDRLNFTTEYIYYMKKND